LKDVPAKNIFAQVEVQLIEPGNCRITGKSKDN
jgi:hypothetical protein